MNSISNNNEIFKNLILLLKNSKKAKMQRYNSQRSTYEKKVIKQILKNYNSNIVSKFKESLLFDDTNEFLKRFYPLSDSRIRIVNCTRYYFEISRIFPNYINHKESKYLYKNFERKQKILDCTVNNDVSQENSELTKIINTEDFDSIMNQTHLNNYKELDDKRIFFHKSYDSITSVENLIDKLDGIESKFFKELDNKNEVTKEKYKKIDKLIIKSSKTLKNLKETINFDRKLTKRLSVPNSMKTIYTNNINKLIIDQDSKIPFLLNSKKTSDLNEKDSPSVINTIKDKLRTNSINKNMVLLKDKMGNKTSMLNSNPFELVNILKKSKVDVLKSMKIFQNFERYPRLTKNKSNLLEKNNHELNKNISNIKTDFKSCSLTRNYKSVNDLMKLSSSLKPQEMKITISSTVNYCKEDNEKLFKTLSVKFENTNSKDYSNNNKKYSTINLKQNNLLSKKNSHNLKLSNGHNTLKEKKKNHHISPKKTLPQLDKNNFLTLNIERLPNNSSQSKAKYISKGVNSDISSLSNNKSLFRRSNI